MQEHILAFKAKMEYYRDNPGLKTGGELYTSDSAVMEIESLINFNFCYTNIECVKKTFELSEVTMPLDELEKINDPDLMQVYYNKIIDTIQAQMGRVNYSNMKLLLVDLENTGTDSNGDAIVSVGALIGKEYLSVLHIDSWIYGEHEGLCGSGWYNDEDAATQLDARVTDAMLPDPPNSCRWFFTAIDHKYINPENDQLNPTPNNYRDYKIYYASDDVAQITETTKCLSGSDMNFYKAYYIDYAQDFEVESGKKFYYCALSGNAYPLPYHIQHDYTIYVGYRFLECTIGVSNF